MLNWKPCRVVHCYKIEDGYTYIIGFDGIIKLNKTATVVWRMANGKNEVRDIVKELQKQYNDISEKMLLNDIEKIIEKLHLKGILINDWDPLLKDKISFKGEL